jgi:exopolyphosphatase/guanosine-5'-triphosphate,3'-diphosphate pyrophosphatase
MSQDEFVANAKKLALLDKKEKQSQYNLNNDRVDVIDSAISIYLQIINKLSISKIKSTRWGISDSAAVKLFHELYSDKIAIKNN